MIVYLLMALLLLAIAYVYVFVGDPYDIRYWATFALTSLVFMKVTRREEL